MNSDWWRLFGIFFLSMALVCGSPMSVQLSYAITTFPSYLKHEIPEALRAHQQLSAARMYTAQPGSQLRQSLVQDVLAEEGASRGAHVAFYYQDLASGVAAGYRENEEFIPASLLKVPVSMALYKEAETDRSLLDTRITYRVPMVRWPQHFAPAESVTPGATYTVRELIERTLRYSDNEAFLLLQQSVTNAGLKDIVRLIGADNERPYVSASQYARMLESLYEGTFLTRASSDHLLFLLSETGFDDGLRTGVPADIPVAHKFGEHKSDSDRQLHDCGIVYLPDHPYVLCVMTIGQDPDVLAKIIADISKDVYRDVVGAYD